MFVCEKSKESIIGEETLAIKIFLCLNIFMQTLTKNDLLKKKTVKVSKI